MIFPRWNPLKILATNEIPKICGTEVSNKCHVHEVPMRKLTWQAGKSPFLIGDTSSNGWFFIAMLVSGGVVSQI